MFMKSKHTKRLLLSLKASNNTRDVSWTTENGDRNFWKKYVSGPVLNALIPHDQVGSQ